ncbi:MAG: heavy metal translocating P-type ATPase [Oscillospiraceae bacterium]|nr:heavy metal translocating P-type ATPase [Oscillospiraceae bacterium]
MKFKILHESRGRLRVHADVRTMTLRQADALEYYLLAQEGVTGAAVYERTCDAVITFTAPRENILRILGLFSYAKGEALMPEQTSRELNREYQDRLADVVLLAAVEKLFFPAPLRAAIAVIKSAKYIYAGFRSLLSGRIEVALLDATAITVSLLRCDFATASSVMRLLKIGEILEEWTHRKSVADLARTMSLNVDKVWLLSDGREALTPIAEVREGDSVIVRTGSMIPLDGRVTDGVATVSQASITGEPLPVRKDLGSYVYAGTVVEEGECVICVDKAAGSGRYDRIVSMIEQSERLKSGAEAKAGRLADKLVPYSLGGTVLTYLITRNVTKALAILMVDFSCALKLAMPLAVLSAMRECGDHGISVKGGKFLEAVAKADTIVLDKTGTLTYATPTVAQVVPFGGIDEDEALRLAACLEEHYPHSMANAIVSEAKRRGLRHEERHSSVEYVVAHGISSSVDGRKVVIGSYHFVFEDEGCVVPESERARFDAISDEYSHLYLAVSGVLAAVICICDPLRTEAPSAIAALKALGIGKVVMMTGDSERTARAVAAKVGVDEYFSEVLPEDKARFISAEHAAGRRVIMVGDGVNDSPALSEADAGIAISEGAAIAREIADITVSADDLNALVTLKALSDALMRRIGVNYRTIISFNLMLIVLGVAGVLPPATSALLHNASTIAISLKSVTNLLPPEG